MPTTPTHTRSFAYKLSNWFVSPEPSKSQKSERNNSDDVLIPLSMSSPRLPRSIIWRSTFDVRVHKHAAPSRTRVARRGQLQFLTLRHCIMFACSQLLHYSHNIYENEIDMLSVLCNVNHYKLYTVAHSRTASNGK